MRQSQKSNRTRNRGRKPSNPLSRSYDSNGPDVKIRGTASHVADKYQSLARDALASGDIVMAENYYQHAEHYLRIIASAQSANRDSDNRQNNSEQSNNGKGGRRPAPAPVELPEEMPQPDINEADLAAELGGDSPAAEANGAEDKGESAAVQADGEGEAAPAPVKPRRRRTTYRPRKRPAADAAGEANGADDQKPLPVSMPDSPQPIVSED